MTSKKALYRFDGSVHSQKERSKTTHVGIEPTTYGLTARRSNR